MLVSMGAGSFTIIVPFATQVPLWSALQFCHVFACSLADASGAVSHTPLQIYSLSIDPRLQTTFLKILLMEANPANRFTWLMHLYYNLVFSWDDYLEWGAMFFLLHFLFLVSSLFPGPLPPVLLVPQSSWTSCPLVSWTTCPLVSWSSGLLVVVYRSRSSTQVVVDLALLQVGNMANGMGKAGLVARVERCK